MNASLLNAYNLLNVTALRGYEQSLFFLAPRDTLLTTRVSEVARRERRPRFSHLAASARVHSRD